MSRSQKTVALTILLVVMVQLSGVSSVNTPEFLEMHGIFDMSEPSAAYVIGGGANFVRSGNDIVLNVITSSLLKCDIYHTIYIYKNGNLIHGKTYYSDGYQVILNNSLTFSGKNGDYFQAYVGHYVRKGGVIEQIESYKSATYHVVP